MKKDHIDIPEPSSKFNQVKCRECSELQIVYSHASTTVMCNSCGNVLTKPTGSKAHMYADLDNTKKI